jgi:hypothetical protein
MPEVSDWYLLSSLLTEVGLGLAVGLLLKHISKTVSSFFSFPVGR